MITDVQIHIDGVEYDLVPTPMGKNGCRRCMLSRQCSIENGTALCQLGNAYAKPFEEILEVGTYHFE